MTLCALYIFVEFKQKSEQQEIKSIVKIDKILAANSSALPRNLTKYLNLRARAYNCPNNLSLTRVGTPIRGGAYGPALVCGIERFLNGERPCVTYSFGVFSDYEFEVEIEHKTNCTIKVYDPTVSVVGKEQSKLRFQPNGSIRNLKSIMQANGHENIDILKVDTDYGFEFSEFEKLFEDFGGKLPVAQLLMEIRTFDPNNYDNVSRLFQNLELSGLRVLDYEENMYDPEFHSLRSQTSNKLVEWARKSEKKWEKDVQNRDKVLRENPMLFFNGSIATIWKLLTPSYTCPYGLTRVGRDGDGGKWVCGVERLTTGAEPCVTYSFGVSGDSSFEADLLQRTNCIIYAYDPTVQSIGKPLTPNNPRVKFHQVGIGFMDTTQGNLRTLKSLMKSNGHEWIDILKIDVEGSEYPSLFRVMDDFQTIPFGQLLIEVHAWQPQNTMNLISLFKALESKGMRAFFNEPNPYDAKCYEFSFLNSQAVGTYFT
ncbi:unnamed protein product [Orchesella dallaii]|uniref:Methyltransferase domain-containing protein n=1 Tax=Orchesella dallaii TaxID=48710 RepID=A0ABP1QFR1_9HEXA